MQKVKVKVLLVVHPTTKYIKLVIRKRFVSRIEVDSLHLEIYFYL